jgi:23S rRNA pseudouridine2605 synthase
MKPNAKKGARKTETREMNSRGTNARANTKPTRTASKKSFKESFKESSKQASAQSPSGKAVAASGKAKRAVSSSAVMRLNKFLADSGVCSRRQADELIAKGVVKVNGATITEHGSRVHLSDLVTVNGEPVNAEKHLTYILLNKPKDYITTTSDEKGRKTVMDLIPLHQRIYPVGRLDRNTTGTILLTNDGEMAHRLMHPSYRVSRMYAAYLDKRLTLADAKKISEGVEITPEDGEPYRSGECNVSIDPEDPRAAFIELAEGKNREVRRIFESLGYEVEKLDRRQYAGITTRGLQRGEYRHLTATEVRALEKLVKLDQRHEEETSAPETRRSKPRVGKRPAAKSLARKG